MPRRFDRLRGTPRLSTSEQMGANDAVGRLSCPGVAGGPQDWEWSDSHNAGRMGLAVPPGDWTWSLGGRSRV